jgi:5-bromo-4-chloroindolyl phosphate hydrolysis protein
MIKRIISFYHDGFKSMRLGKTLWIVVIVKLVIIFVVLKLFFMPDILYERADGNEAEYVSKQITGRAAEK